MPFTLAHPAAILPLVRRPFVGLALVCGAVAPDVPYYLRAMRLPVTAQSWYEPLTNATTTHSPAGLVLVALPLGLMLYVVLLAAAPPVAWLVDAPDDGPPRRAVASLRVPAHWWWVLVSLLIGLVTHLVWDSATSSDGFLTAWFTGLDGLAVAGLTWVQLLGHASTLLALVLVAIALGRRRDALAPTSPGARRRSLTVLAGLALVGLVAAALSVATSVDVSAATDAGDLLETILSRAATGGAASVVVVLVLAVVGWWIWRGVSHWTGERVGVDPR